MTAEAAAVVGARGTSQRAVLAVLYTGTAAVYADMYIAQPILPLLSRAFAIRPATAGLSVSVVVLAIALASSVYGLLSDAVGRKSVMVWSCLLLTIPTLLCAVAPSFPLLLLARGVQGLLIPGLSGVAVAYLGDRFSGAELGGIVGRYVGASVAGSLTGRVLSGFVADHFSWRAPFAAFAVVTLVAAVAMARVLPQDRIVGTVQWRGAYGGMFNHFRNRQLLGAFLIGGTLFFAYIGIFTYLPYYLIGAPFHLSTGLVSSVYIVYLTGVITSPLAGRLAHRMTRPAILAMGMVIAGIGIAGTLVVSLPVIVVSLIVLCGGMFVAQSTAPTFVNLTAREAKGSASALYLAFYYTGATFGSVLPGFAWQAWGWPGVTITCGVSLGFGLLADWLLCRGQRNENEERFTVT